MFQKTIKVWGCLLLSGVVLTPTVAEAAPVKRQNSTLKWPSFRQTPNRKFVAEVAAIQYLLRSRGLAVRKIDGIFGAQTASAVRAFQRKNGLKADGILGSKTLPKLVIRLKRGDRGDAVRALQTLLREPMNEVGEQPFKSHAVDGVFGPKTDELVRYMQSDWIGHFGGPKTKSDGIVGPQTWCVLFGGQL
ncbi:MAG TPA: peptidoglycan-binding protein [Abditibacterium sp.]|jgi:peptidoglycan hydrolase-like protein with peptidoglycan-binding domain